MIDAVSPLVAFQFRYPVIQSGLREMRCAALLVKVPEATIHEDDFFSGAKNKIGLARKVLGVEPITKPKPRNDAANGTFGCGVGASYPTHRLAS